MFLNIPISRQQRLWLIGAALFAAALGGASAGAEAPSAADKVLASVQGQHIVYVDYTPLMVGKTEWGQPLVHVKINDTQEATFLVDTGFTSSVISADLADKMGLRRENGVGKDGKPFTWGGKPTKITRVSSIQVGPITFADVPILVLKPGQFNILPRSTIDGVLGINVLHTLALYVDGPEHKLGFCTPGAFDDAQFKQLGMTQPAVVPFKERSRGWFIPAQVSDGSSSGTQEMLVDTGSNATSVSDVIARQLKLKSIIKVGVTDLDGSSVISKTSVPLLHLGSLVLTDQPVSIDPPLPPSPTALLHDPSPVLGMDVLSSYHVLLDFPGGKMYIQQPPSLLPKAGSAYIAEQPAPDTAAAIQAKALVEQGLADATAGHVDLAFTKYNKALALDPANIGALNHRSRAYSNTAKNDLALADAQQAVLLAPHSAEAHLSLALAFAHSGKIAEALSEFRQTIAAEPPTAPKAEVAEVFFALGVTYGVLDNPHQAIAAYTQAVTIDQANYNSYTNRGSNYHALGDDVRAIADETTVITLAPPKTPALPIAYGARGLVYNQNGDYDKAVADFSNSITLDPKLAAAYAGRGKAYGLKQDTAHAISDFTQAIALAPSEAENYYNRGVARAGVDNDAAIVDYTQAIMLDPKYITAYVNRGTLYKDKGDEDKAIADATTALTLLPPGDSGVAFTLYNRSLAYAKKGDKAKAAADRAEAFKLNPDLSKQVEKK